MAEARHRGLVEATSPWGSRLRLLLFVAGMVLAGEILTQGVSDELAATRPGLAVIWRSDSADALAALASEEVGRGQNGAAIAFALRSLELSPLQSSALSSFAVALDRSGKDPQRAERMMSVAGGQGWRDPVAQVWLARRRLAEDGYADGFARADAVVRVSPQTEPDMFGAMTAAVQSGAAVAPLATRLATGPGWRGRFLAALAADPRPGSEAAMLGVLAALKTGAHPATSDELALYPERLIAQGRVQDAWRAWRALSMPVTAPGQYLYDGDFAQLAADGPFDWVLKPDVGWTPTVGPAPGRRGKALAVDYDGYAQPAPLGQRIVLPPGVYRLSGQILAQATAGSGRMRWIILCDPSRQEVGDTGPIAAVPGRWTAFETTFTAPAHDCPSQRVTLTAVSADAPAEIQVWFDDLAISAAPAR